MKKPTIIPVVNVIEVGQASTLTQGTIHTGFKWGSPGHRG